ncbi:MBL fold metallo-hydrolase [Deinococcus cellulosilyticus]|uniref:Hydrolase n=1 Tax=Deinococcus cellulosilyticus (strain DSM 18568 / NBRC 106333 / KACC 11606 / 5516J-15) TaxID=1223518 RepID=A0A511N196_DEIC1|nr:MBL fold metallo-hydrolase [Deinococcus cellulosilyticus]GEM46221.1 hydrolase [Deinococcus cellulosilyticus NBRC 106333 = KACC 11606]
MKLNDHVFALPITWTAGPITRTFHLTALVDATGVTLVDAGLPGMLPEVRRSLQEVGLQLSDLRQVILTHSDIDHAGGARELVEATGASVWASDLEVPYLQGSLPALKPLPVRLLEQLDPRTRQRIEKGAPPVEVNRTLMDGEWLPIAGGVQVLFTPGHTPGHLSLWAEGVLVAGDAVMVKGGQVMLPENTLDPMVALASLRSLGHLNVRSLLAHHGGLLRGEDLLGGWRDPGQEALA